MTEPLIDTEVQGTAGASQPDDAAAILDALERHEADAVLSRDGLSYLRAQEVYDRERQAEAALRRSQQRPHCIWRARRSTTPTSYPVR